jgi:chaperonin GroEL
MVKEGLRNVAAGANPAALKRGMDAAVDALNDKLLEVARDVEGRQEIAHVATVSAQDPAIGDLIAEAFDKVGKDGVITVEESSTTAMEVEFTEGMQFDKGYISPYFVTDHDRMEAVSGCLPPGPPGNLRVADLLPLLEKVAGRQAAVIIAEDVDGSVVHARGQHPWHVPPDRRQGARPATVARPCCRMAVLTGAQVISPDIGLKLDQVDLTCSARPGAWW